MTKIAVVISYLVVTDVPDPPTRGSEEQWLADWHADIMDDPQDFLDGKEAELSVSITKFASK